MPAGYGPAATPRPYAQSLPGVETRLLGGLGTAASLCIFRVLALFDGAAGGGSAWPRAAVA